MRGKGNGMKIWISVVLNVLILGFTIFTVADDAAGKNGKRNFKAFRYYTILSNVLGALASAVMLISTALGEIPRWVYVLKFTSAVSLSVTLVTVCVFLAPRAGFGVMFSGRNLYLHAAGPVMAWTAFCLFEKGTRLSGAMWMYGVLPTLLYGLIYAYMVLIRTEDRGGWPDFYGFNRGVRWYVSFAAMIAGCVLLCLLTAFVYNG